MHTLMFVLYPCTFYAKLPSLVFVPVRRRDRDRVSTLNLSTDVDSELLDFEDHFSSPSSFYAGTGGKPPLAFRIDKPSRKR